MPRRLIVHKELIEWDSNEMKEMVDVVLVEVVGYRGMSMRWTGSMRAAPE